LGLGFVKHEIGNNNIYLHGQQSREDNFYVHRIILQMFLL
jgi:hypothetical protein